MFLSNGINAQLPFAEKGKEENRAQRVLPLRQRKEIQEVPRKKLKPLAFA
jgi:hypothetical protein